MRIPVEWLNIYLSRKLSTQEIAEALERAGVEVDGVVEAPRLDPKIVVGEVLKADAHPNADKLMLTTVDTGQGKKQIVCGAPNVAAAQKVAVALPGSKLPDGMEIKATSIRGQESNGMICSENELGIGTDHSGILVLPPASVVGTAITKLISHSDVINTSTAANRWDLHGLVWLAHEVGAQTKQKIRLKSPEQLNSSNGIKVTVDPKNVNRYMLAKLNVDSNAPTPVWMRQRLLAGGVRPVSIVVDITNYVMLELGQPLHAFDAAKVREPVDVRTAKPGETIITLDGKKRKLHSEDLLITDRSGAIGIAGVMGGANSEVDETTTEIYLESASFSATSVRKTAVRHNLRSEASARFERSVPPDLAPMALTRAVSLLEDLADGELVGAAHDTVVAKSKVTEVKADPAKINSLIGLELSSSKMKQYLESLEFEVLASKDRLNVRPPWWRTDVSEWPDVAEEVIRMLGFEQLPSTLPEWRPEGIKADRRWPNIWKAKTTLRASGLNEVQTYSFVSPEQLELVGAKAGDFLKLKNPLSSEQSYLRTSLLPSLLKVAERNRGYAKTFGLFEYSRVYVSQGPGKLPEEPFHLGGLVRSPTQAYKAAKGALDQLGREFGVDFEVRPSTAPSIMHPARFGELLAGGKKFGVIGEVSPLVTSQLKAGPLGCFELNWETFLALSQPKKSQPISKYPSVSRDISVAVGRDVTWQDVKSALADFNPEFLNDYYGADVGAGKKGIAVRVNKVSLERTLTDKDADEMAASALKTLKSKFSAVSR